MSGAMLALAGAGAAGGYSGSPGAISWSNLTGIGGSSTNSVTLSGVTGAMSVTASQTGLGYLYYTVGSGALTRYAGAFLWPEGETLTWTMTAAGGSVSGTVSVTDATTSTSLGSFTYVLTSPGGLGGGGGFIDP
jgi:hypothetical protein